MSYRVALPDGRTVEFPDEVPREEAARIIANQLGDGSKPQGGFGAAFKSGLAGLQQNMADLGANLGIRDKAGAMRDIEDLEALQQRTFKPTEEGWTEAPWTKFKETLGGSLPHVLGPIAGGIVAGPVGAGIASLGQFTGSNLSRQREEGQEQNLPIAAAAAVPQAALDVLAFKMIPGIRAIMGVPENVATNIAKQGAAKVAGDYAKATGKAMAAESTTEAAQQFLERLQAGLETSPDDPQAKQEYVESLIGGAVLGGALSVPGRHIERGQEQDRFREQERFKNAEAAKVEAARVAADEEAQAAYRKTPQYLAEVERNWADAQARMEELKQAVQMIPKDGEFTKEDRAEAHRAVNEFGRSEEYQQAREAFRVARPQIAQQAHIRQQMAGQQDPLAGRGGESFPAAQPAQAVPVEERIEQIMADPQAAQRVVSGEVKIGNTPKEQRAVQQAVARQFKERQLQAAEAEAVAKQRQEQEQAQRQSLPLMGQQDPLAGRMQQPEFPPAQAVPPAQASEAMPEVEREPEAADVLEHLDRPRMEPLWEKALHAQGSQPVEVSPDIRPLPNADKLRDEVDRLYAELTKGHDTMDSALRAGERDVAAKQTQGMSAARQRLDMMGREADPYRRELVRLRDEQQSALREIDGGLMDMAAGFYFGGSNPEGASSLRDGVVKQIEQARDRYTQAALREAATHAQALGKALPQDHAIKIASNLRDRFDEYIEQRLDQIAIDDEYRKDGAERKNIKPTFTRQVEFKENKSGLMPDEAAALQDELFELRRVRAAMIEPRLQEVATKRGPGVHALRKLASDIDNRIERASQRLMRHVQNNGEAKAPRTRTQKPKTSFADNVTSATRALVAPQRDTRIAEKFVGPRLPKPDTTPKEDPVELPPKVEERKPTPEEAEAKVVEHDWQKALDKDVKDKLDTVSEAESEFLKARQQSMDSWRAAMRAWHMGPEIKKLQERTQLARKMLERQKALIARSVRTETDEAGEEVYHANKKVRDALFAKKTQLESDLQKLEDELTDKRETAANVVSESEAWVRALQDKNVQRKYEALDKARKKLEQAKADKEANRIIGPLEKEARQRRQEMDRAIKERDDRSAELSKKKEEWTKKMVTGLDLPGRRYTADTKQIIVGTDKHLGDEKMAVAKRRNVPVRVTHDDGTSERVVAPRTMRTVEPLITAAQKADEKKSEENLNAMREAAIVAVGGSTARSNIKRVAGPVARPKTGGGKNLSQARRDDENKDPAKAVEDLESVQRELAQEANEDAEQIKKEIGDKPTRAKMEADRAAIQAELAGLLFDKKAKDKDVVNALERLWAVEEQLAPYKELDAKQAEAAAKIARKKEREAKRMRKQKNIREKMNEANANATRKRKAVEEIEEDYDAVEAMTFGDKDADTFHWLTDGGKSFKVIRDYGDISHDRSAPWDGMNFRQASEWGAKNTKDPFERMVFQRLATVFSKYSKENAGHVFGAEYRDDEFGPVGDFAFGGYEDAQHLIFVRPHMKDSVQTLLHELVHAATIRAMKHDPELRGWADDLRREALNNGLDKKAHYGLTNANEFIAEAMANPDFQLALSQIKSIAPKETLWSKFVKGIMKLLGLDKPSLLTDAFELTERMLKVSEKGRGLKAASGDAGVIAWRNPPPDSVIFAKKPSAADKFMANTLGLGARVQFIDRYAAASEGINIGKDKAMLDENQALAGHYFLRMGEQTTQAAGQFLTHGPVKVVKDHVKGGTQERYESAKGVTAVDIAQTLRAAGEAAGWDEGYTEYAMGTLVAGERAKSLQDGWTRLAGKNAAAAKAEYDAVASAARAKPEVKQLMDEAMRQYKEFNNGLIDFVVATGAVRKDRGEALKRLPYIPWYRVMGNEVKLWVDGEKPITIGNIADNPDLKELVGDDSQILPFWTAMMQNTFMLSRMGLRNKSTMETAKALNLAGFVSKMGKGPGPGGESTVHYRVGGDDYFATIDQDQFGIPAHLIVKGMDGIKTMLPMWVRMLGMPANLLRKMVTRSPAYIVRQIIRDPVNAAIIGGVDGVPIANALKHIAKTTMGRNDEEHDLMHGLAISSNIYTGDARDMEQFMKQIVGGDKAWRKSLNFLDNMALQADSSTRAAVYEDSIRKGFTKAEAALRALEIQNFSRKGLSPGMQMLSVIIPFFNAQVQGLDVLYRAFKGDVPFAERLEIKKKLWSRGMMLAATTWAYAAMMQEDEDYLKARPQERYQNFLIRTPWTEDYFKVPIPFETGLIFKALVEAAVDASSDNTTASEAMKGIARLGLGAIPGGTSWGMPAALSPAIQAAFGQTTFAPIETTREKALEPWARYRENTSELAKALGQAGNVSPLMIDHFIRGYAGSLGIAAVRMLDPMLESEGQGASESPKTAADGLLFGSLFQRKESRYMVERAFERLDEINKAQKTYKELIAQGKGAEARQYAQDKANEIAMASMAGMYKQQMGGTFAMERAIRNHPTMPTERKKELLQKLKNAQNAQAQAFFGKTTPQERRP